MKKHSRRRCPYLHVKNCPGCGRSCRCHEPPRRPQLRSPRLSWISRQILRLYPPDKLADALLADFDAMDRPFRQALRRRIPSSE